MPKVKKDEKEVRSRITITIYHPNPEIKETLRPQFLFEGEHISMKSTLQIFSYMRHALRQEGVRQRREGENDGRRTESESSK